MGNRTGERRRPTVRARRSVSVPGGDSRDQPTNRLSRSVVGRRAGRSRRKTANGPAVRRFLRMRAALCRQRRLVV